MNCNLVKKVSKKERDSFSFSSKIGSYIKNSFFKLYLAKIHLVKSSVSKGSFKRLADWQIALLLFMLFVLAEVSLVAALTLLPLLFVFSSGLLEGDGSGSMTILLLFGLE